MIPRYSSLSDEEFDMSLGRISLTIWPGGQFSPFPHWGHMGGRGVGSE